MWRGDPPFRIMKQEMKPELLSPAGDFETLLSVVNAGADAVYLGMQRFGARAYAKNFTKEELLEGLSYAHLHHAKLYLTVNTLYKEEELPELLFELEPFYAAGLDGVIVQDFGAFSLIRKSFPRLSLHASTQMAVTGAEGAALLKSMGAERVVLARELTLPEIRHVSETVDIELECFIHGALCYGFSGLCLMSSMLGGRSGNRGRCAGTCRLPFSVNGGEPCYPLSLKDLCTIELLPDILDAGVRSLKIEGRMKSPEYAGGVTSIYRKYLDRILSGKAGDYRVEEEDRRALLDLGNRTGFTRGYYEKRNDPGMVTVETPSHSHAADETLKDRYGHFREKQPVLITGHAVLRKGKPTSLTAEWEGTSVTAYGTAPTEAKNRPLTKENVREKLLKTGDTSFAFQELSIDMEEDLFLPVRELNELRRSALTFLLHQLSEPFARHDASVIGSGEKGKKRREEAPRITVHLMNRSLLQTVLAEKKADTVILDSALYKRESLLSSLSRDIDLCREHGKSVRFALPYIFRMDTAAFFDRIWPELTMLSPDELMIRNPDEIGFLLRHPFENDRVVLDERLYAWSTASAECFREIGFWHLTLPLELSFRELSALPAGEAELIVYGRIPLMITAGCIRKNFSVCDQRNGEMTLTDRFHKVFPVKMLCDPCVNLIYNPDIYRISEDTEDIKSISPASIRYSFTFETPEEVSEVLSGIKNERVTYTRGHLRKGIE